MFRIETGDGYGGVRERRMPRTRGFNRSNRGGISKTSSSHTGLDVGGGTGLT